MTPDSFRRLALALPETSESSHQQHPDFQVRGKVFATLGWPDENWAMVKLTPEQQEILTAAEPLVFRPVPGGWGRRGSTNIHLEQATEADAKSALTMAWRNVTEKLQGQRNQTRK